MFEYYFFDLNFVQKSWLVICFFKPLTADLEKATRLNELKTNRINYKVKLYLYEYPFVCENFYIFFNVIECAIKVYI